MLLAHDIAFLQADIDQQRFDLNDDSLVTPLDGLIAVNAVNRAHSHAGPPPQRLDVTGDGQLNVDDVDMVLANLEHPQNFDGIKASQGNGSESPGAELGTIAELMNAEESSRSSLWMAESEDVVFSEGNAR